MTSLFWLGLCATLFIIVALSVYSGKNSKGKSAKNSLPVVTGLIMGTLVGGSSTIGTAQLAYNFGMSAWWFTLGGGISCLILGLIYAKPLRNMGQPTLVGMIRKEFGAPTGLAASILSSVGTYINIISQLISATAVIAVVFPSMNIVESLLISSVFMVLYVVFGGTKGAGIVGIVKTVLLYVAMITCGIMALHIIGGVPQFFDMVKNIDNPDNINFFSLFSRGVGTDLGACLSLILGVLTTQTYAQGVISGKTDRDGVLGAILSAFLIPPIGIGGIIVGLYMRANAALYPGLTAKTALTTFVTSHMPPLISGIILGALFITVVGTGAGLTLGIATIINNDIIKRKSDSQFLLRVWIVLILGLACLMSTGGLGDTILKFAFMSMGLRGAVIFVPLLCALWLPGKVKHLNAFLSVIISPIVVLIFGILDILPFDPLFIGIIISVIIIAAGYERKKL